MPWHSLIDRNDKYREAVCYVSTVDCTPTLSHQALLILIYSSLKIGPTPKNMQITPPPFLNEVTTEDAFLFLVHARSTKETIQKAGNMLPAFWIVSLVLLACTRKRKASSVVTSFKKGGGVICIFLGVGPIFKLEYIKIRRA